MKEAKRLLVKKNKKSILTVLLFSYAIFIVFMHSAISHFVVKKHQTPWGEYSLRPHSVEFTIAALIIILSYLIYRYIHGTRKTVTFLYFFLLAEFLFFIYSVLSLHPVEVVHFLHYGILAFLLGMIWDKKRERILFVKILVVLAPLAFIDEITFQYYLGVHQKYLDLSDGYFNFIGVILGALLFYAFTEPEREYENKAPIFKTRSFQLFAVFVFIVSVLFLFEVIQISPPEKLNGGPWLIDENHFIIYLERIPGLIGGFNHHFIRGLYYIPTPVEMLLLTIFTGVVFSTYDPRYIVRLKSIFKKKARVE